MFYKKIFYYFKEALSEKLCDDIIQIAMDDKPDVATTGIKIRNDEDVKNLLQKRDSYITWLNEEWIYKEIRPYVHRANKLAGWNFDIVDSEPCQFTIYNEGQYYGWHTDSSGLYYEKEKQNGLIRKLSVTVSLSHPHEYEGGVLEFDNRMENEPDSKHYIVPCKQVLPKGSICVFPSFTHHRVSPVTKGKRLSLVQWNLGPEWR
jgi:PKHD-type hydroxylase|tara:strand:- start:1536 stop:2147 length:612 start_codon:yes stop_codon:yes gene_type:complete